MNFSLILKKTLRRTRCKALTLSWAVLGSSLLFSTFAHAGWSDFRGKYFGSILGPTDQANGDYSLFIPNDYTDYFNQVTAENDNKWGYVEEPRGTYNDSQGQQVYQFAVANDIPFKFHALLWGHADHDDDTWRASLSDDEIVAAVTDWFEYVRDNYPETTYIDVANEVLNEELSFASAFNGRVAADFGKAYTNNISFNCDMNDSTPDQVCNIEWVVWAFLKAREVFGPNVQLLINDYRIINGEKSGAYKEIIQLLQSYDFNGQPIINGIGIQAHLFNVSSWGGQNTATIQGVLDDLATTGLPIHIAELDIDYKLSDERRNNGNPLELPGDSAQMDTEQLEEYERVLPLMWNHPGVVGVTLWGYSIGKSWNNYHSGLVTHSSTGDYVSHRPAFDSIYNIITFGYPPPNNFNNPVGAGVNTGRTTDSGDPIAHWQVPFEITAEACGDGTMGTATYVLSFEEGHADVTGTMTILADGSFTATIGPLEPSHGPANLEITRNCGMITRVANVPMYIDPSGVVRTVEGEPLVGATVTLYRSDNNTGPFTIVPDGSTIMAPHNRTNPDKTAREGAFGWDVVTGYYKVRAEYPGCVSPTNESQAWVETEIMFIPPEVTNLDIRLKCPTFSSGIEVVKTSDWGSGYCANVIVKNRNSTPLDWDVAFTTEGTIYDFWNANYAQYGENIYADGITWNNILGGGESSRDVGFCANRSGSPGTGSYPITVRARGTSGQETINLTVGGQVVATWNLSPNFQNYTVTTSLGGGINVEYINDAPNRDVVVDKVTINGVVHEAEAQTNNTAAWDGSCGAGSFSEWMHCNGYIGFSAFK